MTETEIQAKKQAKEKKSSTVGELVLLEGGVTADLIRRYPELLTKDIPKIQRNYQVYQELEQLEQHEQTGVLLKDVYKEHHYPTVLEKILDSTQKKSHLWICGPANSGKTYFMERLMDLGVNVFMGPYNNDWIGFNQDLHQIIWFDEFKGQLTIQQLNALCDVHSQLNVKGGSYRKTKRIPVIICSNYTMEQAYSKALERDDAILNALKARFHGVKLKPV